MYWVFTSPTIGLNPIWQRFTFSIARVYTFLSVFFLNFFSVESEARGVAIFLIQSGKTVFVKEHCLAIPAMVIFTGAILLFPGNQMQKVWFIPLGLLGIVIINLFRLVFVAIAFQYFPDSIFNFNHSVLYVILTYSLIFAMIVWWMKKEERLRTG